MSTNSLKRKRVNTVTNFNKQVNVRVLNTQFNNLGNPYVKLNNSNFWYKVIRGKFITTNAPWIYNSNNKAFFPNPNNNNNRRKVYATVPSGYAVNANGKMYKLANFPANQRRHAGLTINVERNGPGQKWRLVNKNLAAKFNLKMKVTKNFGLWAGQLLNKH